MLIDAPACALGSFLCAAMVMSCNISKHPSRRRLYTLCEAKVIILLDATARQTAVHSPLSSMHGAISDGHASLIL